MKAGNCIDFRITAAAPSMSSLPSRITFVMPTVELFRRDCQDRSFPVLLRFAPFLWVVQDIDSIRFEPTLLNSNACSPNSFARSRQARIRARYFLWHRVSENTRRCPYWRLTTARIPPPTPLLAGRPTRKAHSPAWS